MAKPLKDQAFATSDKVAELVQKVCHYNYLHYLFIELQNSFCERILCEELLQLGDDKNK